MQRSSLRAQILENTFLWLITNLVSLALIFFFDPRSSVGSAFSIAVANLTAVCILVPPRALYRFKKRHQMLQCFCAVFIISPPWLLLAWLKLPVLQTPLFHGGWLILCGMLIYVYLAMIAALALSYHWLVIKKCWVYSETFRLEGTYEQDSQS